METTVLYWGSIGIVEKNMETTFFDECVCATTRIHSSFSYKQH